MGRTGGAWGPRDVFADWLLIMLAQHWWRGHPIARAVVAFVLLCGLCELVLGVCHITPTTPQSEKAFALAELLACAAAAWLLSGAPGYWRMWHAWRHRRPWYADFYEANTDRLR